MKGTNNIFFVFILMLILLLNLNSSGQRKLSYKVLGEFNSQVKEIGGMAILSDTLFLYDISNNKISSINLQTQQVINSNKIYDKNILRFAIDPISKEVTAIDANYNLLIGNLNNSFDFIYHKKNIGDIIRGNVLLNKIRGICYAKNCYFVSTDDGWSSAIYSISKDLINIKFISYLVGDPPYALTYDGQNIWCLSKTTDEKGVILRYNSQGTLDAYVDTDLKNITDIFFDGHFFWIKNSAQNNILKIDIILGGN
jgi:hypothetical protein